MTDDFLLLDSSLTLRNLSKDEKEAVKTLIALALVEANDKTKEEIELPQERLEILEYDCATILQWTTRLFMWNNKRVI